VGILDHLLSQRRILVGEEVRVEAKESTPNKGTLDTSNPTMLAYQSGSLLFTLLGGVNESQIERLRATLKVKR